MFYVHENTACPSLTFKSKVETVQLLLAQSIDQRKQTVEQKRSLTRRKRWTRSWGQAQKRHNAVCKFNSIYLCVFRVRTEQDVSSTAGQEASAHSQPAHSVLPCRVALYLENTDAQEPGLWGIKKDKSFPDKNQHPTVTFLKTDVNCSLKFLSFFWNPAVFELYKSKSKWAHKGVLNQI